MRVYLAAPYGARALVAQYAEELTRIGYVVTSSWLAETHDITPGKSGAAAELSDAQVATHAATDLHDIDRSHLLVLFTSKSVGVEGGGGRHVETGYAIARDLPVLIVGDPENVFHRLGRTCSLVPDWHEALIELAARLVSSRHDQTEERAS